MNTVKKGDTIRVHYTGKLTSGELFDSSEGRDPLEFQVGAGHVIRGFDDGVLQMQVGDKRTIQIPVDQAYGPRNEDLIMEFPADRLPEDLKPEEGMQLQLNNEQGQNFPVVVRAVSAESITLDGNHPLAGEELIFDIELVEIV